MRRYLVVALVAAPLMLAACGDDDSSESETTAADTTATETTTEAASGSGSAETVAISETEFALDPADPTAKAGAVTLEVTNDGGTAHDLEIEGDGVEEKTATLAPGDSDELTVDLAAGSYELYCTIGDHRDQGMEGTLTVE